MSQVEMAYDILQRVGGPLHISDILDRIARLHGQRLDRESLVSALVKKVQRQDRFTRTGKNIFALKGGQ
jgi:DNA-directed RNA polymerase delta subunit